VCDFILHHKVTYPHTLYEDVRELPPAAVHAIGEQGVRTATYWQPADNCRRYRRMSDAANDAREVLRDLLQRAATEYGRLSFLLSAGEDSRTLLSLAPREVARHCITVAPSLNREAHIAKSVADALNASWEFHEQSPESYLLDLGRRALLSGSGGLAIHAHLLGIVRRSSLTNQPVVIGGFGSDAFLKGHFYKVNSQLLALGYQQLIANRENIDVRELQPLDGDILSEIASRRRAHERRLAGVRANGINEWMACWPMSQDHEIVNFWSNRRLFASLEAFMCPAILEIAASIPPDWVLNRRLFNKMAAPVLRETRWIAHGEGHYPAFSWKTNLVLRPTVRALRRLGHIGRRRTYPFAWPNADSFVANPRFKEILGRQVARWTEHADPALRCAALVSQLPGAGAMQRLAAVQVLAARDVIATIAQDAPAKRA